MGGRGAGSSIAKGVSTKLTSKTGEQKKENSNVLELKKLEGTPKQIAWAEKIRRELIASNLFAPHFINGDFIKPNGEVLTIEELKGMLKTDDCVIKKGDTEETKQIKKDTAAEIEECINCVTKTDAKWFIENRKH